MLPSKLVGDLHFRFAQELPENWRSRSGLRLLRHGIFQPLRNNHIPYFYRLN